MATASPYTCTEQILVIGYGNSLRQDDGVGLRVAERIAGLEFPDVQTITCAQLSPEHAPLVAEAGVVVFVDAMLGADPHVRLQPLSPSESAQVTTHALEPETLLALAREVYGRAPRAWLLPVPARNTGFGEQLSPEAKAGMVEAVRVLDGFIQLRLAWRASRDYDAAAR